MAGRRAVWIVDDSPLDRDAARRALEAFETEVFTDGSAVIERLAAGGPGPDLLVLDWVMPGVSGIDVVRHVRALPGPHSGTAILLLTGARATEQVVEGLQAGANDYLFKPYAAEELRARAASLIRARELIERVEKAEETVRKLLTHVPDALIVTDAHGVLTYANGEAERIFGQPITALIGRPIAELLPQLELHRVAGSSAPVTAVPDIAIGDEVYAPRVRFLPGDFAAATTVALRNVTERRRTEERRLDFYSIIAHDLRSPLSAMLLRTELIMRGRRGVLPAEVIADLHKMEASMRGMVSLINDFLDLARLEGGGYKLERQELDAAALIGETVEDIRPIVEESRIRLDVEVPSGPLTLVGDRHRLQQVTTNLLSNALKFTPAGGRVRVAVARRGDAVEIEVADTGRGIAPDKIPTLFQRYTRAEGSHAVGGTGLGLMIVREIVEAHGGTVGVDSRVGEGTRFWVRLPAVARGVAGEVEVLVVDDDDEIRESVQFVLESAGYQVAAAKNGREALDYLNAGPLPAVVLLDLQMPVMTGLELLAAMRTDPRLARQPVCVMSGDLSILDKAPPGSLVLQKPIQVPRMLEFVARYTGRGGAAIAANGRR